MQLHNACRVVIANIVVERHVEHVTALTIRVVVIQVLLELGTPLGRLRAPVASPVKFLAHVSKFQKSVLFSSNRIKDLHCIEHCKKYCSI